MKEIHVLASYVPSMVVSHCLKEECKLPSRQQYETVCMFCDVSGFTALSEKMAILGVGAEGLKKHLNSYFGQMSKIISGSGGDVFKFAGDAMIVLWPPSIESMDLRCRRAVQAGLEIQSALDRAQLDQGVELSVKIGIGAGVVTVLHIGGVCDRIEYLALGEPLLQAFGAEHHATRGQVVCAKSVWHYLGIEDSIAEDVGDGFMALDSKAKHHKDLRCTKSQSIAKLLDAIIAEASNRIDLEMRLRSYIPESALVYLNNSADEEKLANELREVCVAFVNLGLTEADMAAAARYAEAVNRVHDVLRLAQAAIFAYGGTVNKFLLDDKGSTFVACFGLPPHSRADDCIRSVLAALQLCANLLEHHALRASVGITLGTVFCGITGAAGGRKEYTVLGDSVNLSARLMQRACTLMDDDDQPTGGIICDEHIRQAAKNLLHFDDLGEIHVKGKAQPIHIYHPYPPSGLDDLRTHNKFLKIHAVLGVKKQASLRSTASTGHQQHQQSKRRGSQKSLTSSSSHNVLHRASTLSSKSRTVAYNAFDNMLTRQLEHVAALSTLDTVLDSLQQEQSMSFNTEIPWNTRSSELRHYSRKRGPRLSCQLFEPRLTVALGPGLPRVALSTVDYDAAYEDADAFWLSGRTTSASVLRKSDTDAKNHTSNSRPKLRHIESCQSTDLDEKSDDQDQEEELGVQIDLSNEKIATLTQLRDRLFAAALGGDPFKKPDDYVLKIIGTRCALPTTNVSVSRLVDYAAAAYGWSSFTKITVVALTLVAKVQLTDIWRLEAARLSLLEHKVQLIDQSTGSLTLIEGRFGVGKTRLLAEFVAGCLLDTAPLVYTTATDISKGHPLATIRSLARDLVKLGADEDALARDTETDEYTALLSAFEAMVLTEKSQKMKPVLVIDDGHYLEGIAWKLLETLATMPIMIVVALRPVVVTQLPASAHIVKLDRLPPEEFAEMLCAELGVHAVTETVCWHLAQQSLCVPLVAREMLATGLDLIYIDRDGRELSDHLRSNEDSPVLAAFRHERHAFVMSHGSPDETDEHRTTFADRFRHTGSRDSSEYVSRLQKSSSVHGGGPLSTEGFSRLLSSSMSMCIEETNVDVKLPPLVARSFLEELNGCTTCQMLILKTIGLLDGPFTRQQLHDYYYINEESDQLDLALNGLIARGFVETHSRGQTKIQADLSLQQRITQGTTPTSTNSTYVLALGPLMAMAVGSRMLTDERRLVTERIKREKARVDDAVMSKYLEKLSEHSAIVSSNTVFKTGILAVRRNVDSAPGAANNFRVFKGRVQGEWKERYCVVCADALRMYKSKHDHEHKVEPTYALPLNEASRVEASGQRFCIDTRSHHKAGHLISEHRVFVLEPPVQADLDSWIATIKLVIERSKRSTTDHQRTTTEEIDITVLSESRPSLAASDIVELAFYSSGRRSSTRSLFDMVSPLHESTTNGHQKSLIKIAVFVGRARGLFNNQVRARPARCLCALLVGDRRVLLAEPRTFANEDDESAPEFDRLWTLELEAKELLDGISLEVLDQRPLTTPDRLGRTQAVHRLTSVYPLDEIEDDSTIQYLDISEQDEAQIEFGAWLRAVVDQESGADLSSSAADALDLVNKMLEEAEQNKKAVAPPKSTSGRRRKSRLASAEKGEDTLEYGLLAQLAEALENSIPLSRDYTFLKKQLLPEGAWWRRWDLDLWQIDSDGMLLNLVDFVMCERLAGGGPSLRLLDPEMRITWTNMLSCVRQLMNSHSSPYHALRHAVDTALTSYCMAVGLGIASDEEEESRIFHGATFCVGKKEVVLSQLELTGLFVAALCHDLDHPGRNNTFLINTKHRLALRYNDISVLENWHAYAMWTILDQPATDIFAMLSKAQRQSMRRQTIAAILATDIARQSDVMRELFMATDNKSADTALPLMRGLLHAADVSNPAKPWHISRTWSDRLLDEFFDQGDEEQSLGLPISPLMDRGSTNQATLSVGFIDHVVLPLYTGMASIHPPIKLCLDHLEQNRATWTEMITSELSSSSANGQRVEAPPSLPPSP